MKVIGVVLARLDSRRLPSKALEDVCGRPLISYAVERAKRVRSLSALVIATSTRPVDDALADYGRTAGIPVHRGSAEDVALRCLQCSRDNFADFFVRINGDSPFLDPALVEEGVRMAGEQPLPDLVTNLIGRTFPYGISVEVVNVATLGRFVRAFDQLEAEHVTKRFYDRPTDFRILQMRSDRSHLSPARLVVDSPEDLERFREIAAQLGPRVALAPYLEVAELYTAHVGRSKQSTAPTFTSGRL